MTGALSRKFCRYYAEQTPPDAEALQSRAPLRPRWFEPLVQPGYAGKALPIWRFSLKSTYDDDAEAVA
ncbi:hypothetical protein D3C80_2109190 [compost metagenome]